MACENPLVGDWESKDVLEGCSSAEGELEVEEDGELTGDGSVTLSDGEFCFDCEFDVEVEDKGDDRYEFEIEFKDCSIGGSNKLEWDCDLEDDELDCGDDAKPYDKWERND